IASSTIVPRCWPRCGLVSSLIRLLPAIVAGASTDPPTSPSTTIARKVSGETRKASRQELRNARLVRSSVDVFGGIDPGRDLVGGRHHRAEPVPAADYPAVLQHRDDRVHGRPFQGVQLVVAPRCPYRSGLWPRGEVFGRPSRIVNRVAHHV